MTAMTTSGATKARTRRLLPLLAVALGAAGPLAVVSAAVAGTDSGSYGLQCRDAAGGEYDPTEVDITASDQYDPVVGGTTMEFRVGFDMPPVNPDVGFDIFLNEVMTTIPVPADLTLVDADFDGAGDFDSVTVEPDGNDLDVTLVAGDDMVLDGVTSYVVPTLVVKATTTVVASDTTVRWSVPGSIHLEVGLAGVPNISYADCDFTDPSDSILTTTVTPNHAPVAQDGYQVVDPATPTPLELVASDSDQPVQTLTYTHTSPADGVLEGEGAHLQYTSTPGFAGVDTFDWTVDDGAGGTAGATFSIYVTDDDMTAPSISITTPAQGAVYQLNSSTPVVADYSCYDAGANSDNSAGGPIQTCVGTTPDGTAVSLASEGPQSLTVYARDDAGNEMRETVSYYVLDMASKAQTYKAVLPLADATKNQIPLECDSAPFAPSGYFQTVSAKTYAARKVASDDGYVVRVKFGSFTVPFATVVDDLTFAFQAPTNGVVSAFGLVPDTGTAAIRDTSSVLHTGNNKVAMKIDEHIEGPYTFKPMELEFRVEEAGDRGATIETRFDYLAFDAAVIPWEPFPIHFACQGGDPDDGDGAEDNPVLTRTTIQDTRPPTLHGPDGDGTSVEPLLDSFYDPGALVRAGYECEDEEIVTSCDGDVADYGLIDTGISGQHLIGMWGVDGGGNTTYEWTAYRVFDPNVSVSGDPSAAEGADPAARFTVTLTNPSENDVQVDYQTFDGTARAGLDYEAASGSLTIPGGATSATIDVPLIDDPTDEDDETFSLELSSAVAAGLDIATAEAVVLDDDQPPLVAATAAISAAEQDYGASLHEIPVVLSEASAKEVTVHWATGDWTALAGADYEAASGTLTFAPGDTEEAIEVIVYGDTLAEGDGVNDEFFAVGLDSPVNASVDVTASGTAVIIVDDD